MARIEPVRTSRRTGTTPAPRGLRDVSVTLIAAANVVQGDDEVTISRPISGDVSVPASRRPVDLALITILSRPRQSAGRGIEVPYQFRVVDPDSSVTWSRDGVHDFPADTTQRMSTEVCALRLDRPGRWWIDVQIVGGQGVSVPIRVFGLVPVP